MKNINFKTVVLVSGLVGLSVLAKSDIAFAQYGGGSSIFSGGFVAVTPTPAPKASETPVVLVTPTAIPSATIIPAQQKSFNKTLKKSPAPSVSPAASATPNELTANLGSSANADSLLTRVWHWIKRHL